MSCEAQRGHGMAAGLLAFVLASYGCAAPVSIAPEHTIDETGKVPAASFFSNSALRHAALSPDGTRVAGVRSVGAEDSIVVISLGERQTEEVLVTEERGARGHRASRRIRDLGWPNDENILYSIETPLRSKEDSWKRIEGQRGSTSAKDRARGTGLRARKSRLYVTDLEGRKRWLGKRWHEAEHSIYQDHIISWLCDDPDHFLVHYEGDAVRVRVDNGATFTVERHRTGYWSWMADHKGDIRVRTEFRDWTTEMSLYYRSPSSRSWDRLIKLDRFEEHGFWFAGYSDDPDTIYVYSDKGPEGYRDKTALFEYDLVRKELGREVLSDPDYDVDSGFLLHLPTDGRLLAVYYYREGPQVHVVDSEWRRIWDRVLETFPEQDVYVQDFDTGATRILLWVASHRSPPSLHLYDTSTGRIEPVVDLYPRLRDLEHAEVEPVRYPSRDGTWIEGYVTRPVGQEGPGPVVVHPHGGPDRRDRRRWDSVTQFLAQRGFTVFQPNVRGSTGYGRAFERAGDHEWGGKIQDDITDGVRWLVSQGIADPERIGIFGVGFGGYAALMGLIKTPDLYRAAASLGGISDVLLHVGYKGGFFRQDSINAHLIGDPLQDRARLIETSPVEQASRIRVPVLLGHGTENPGVHEEQSKRMARALRAAGGEVELHLYDGATDRFLDERDRIDFYRRLGDFFERHLLTDASSAPPNPESR
jgi:dipeptidyl aminopeptidase/acylaminoacyl peptidase